MFLRVGFVIALVLAISLTNGEKYFYPLINMSTTPYDQTPCPESCGKVLDTGLSILSVVFGSVLKEVAYPVEFCDECIVSGLHGFNFQHKCFMSPDNNVFDHLVVMNFPHFMVNCKCNFSNSPSAMAETINSGKTVNGEHCGKDDLANKHSCDPIKCSGGEGQGESPIKLAADLSSITVKVILRIDNRANEVTKQVGAFPIEFSLLSDREIKITHDGPAEFDNSWKCLEENMKGFVCKLFVNGPTPYFDCLTPDTTASLVHALLYMFGKC